MRRIKIDTRKWQGVIPALFLCFACFVAIPGKAADVEPEAIAEPETIAPGRPGVLTGLGELALSRAYPDEAVWLGLGNDDRVLGLLLTERSLPTKGALMILPEAGETAASGVAGRLSQLLADEGWAVLTVGLEAPSSSLRARLERKPDRPKSAPGTSADEPASPVVDIRVDDPADKPEAKYRERIQKTLQAGVSELASRGYDSTALLAIGRASNYLTDPPSAGDDVQAIIWVAPVFYPRDKATLASHLSASSVQAVLELYDAQIDSEVSGKQRAVALHQADVNGYERQPVAVHQPLSVQDAPALANRVDAWLLSQ